MTFRGLICLVLDVLLFVVAIGSGIRALLAVALFFGVFFLFALLSVGFALLTLRAESTLNTAVCTRGDEVEYRFTVRGVVVLPVTGRIAIMAPGAQKEEKDHWHRHAFLLLPSFKRKEVFELTMPCIHRGRWMVGPKLWRLRDVFGLFSVPLIHHGKKQPVPISMSVYPRTYEVVSPQNDPVAVEGFHQALVKTSENGDLFGDTRDQRPGDPLKRIHWKQSARLQKLMLRQFEAQENAQVLVLLDLATVQPQAVSVGDMAAEIVASLVFYAGKLQKTVQVAFLRGNEKSVDGEETLWIHGDRDTPELLDKLTDALFYHAGEPFAPWQLRDSRYACAGNIWVVTNQPSQTLLDDLDSLQIEGRQVALFVPMLACDEEQKESRLTALSKRFPVLEKLPFVTARELRINPCASLKVGEVAPVTILNSGEIPEKVRVSV